MLTRARSLGIIPWRAMPSAAGALDLQHMPLNNGGATGFTLSTERPDGTTRGIDGYLRNLNRSGPDAANTAGWFGIGSPAPARHACAAAGWVFHWITGGAISVVGRAGHFIGDTFAVDATFRPERAVGAVGWVKIQGASPAVWRRYLGTPDVTEALSSGVVLADGRYFARAIGVAAQDPAGPVVGRAIMVDLSNRDLPVVVDRFTFTLPTPTEPKGVEWNHSATPTTGAAPLDLNLTHAEGSFGVRRLS